MAYAEYYKKGGMQTADKIENVCDLLGGSRAVEGSDVADLAHALKYFDRIGLKGDASLDTYKCADWFHRLITGKFLHDVIDKEVPDAARD